MNDWSEHAAMLPSKCSALTNALADRRWETACRITDEIREHAEELSLWARQREAAERPCPVALEQT
jgi:hypothetical protein